MKKIGIVLAILVALTFVVGCGSTGGAAKTAAAPDVKPYSIDLSTLTYQLFSDKTGILPTGAGKGVKNTTPIAARYDGLLYSFAGSNLPADITQYKRVTINAKYFDAQGNEIAQGDGKAMVVLVYDLKGDLKGPEMGAGKNTPLKEFNLGGFSGAVSQDKGSRVTLGQAPGGVLLQASDPSVKFIELTQITFHNGSASGAAQ